MTLPNELAAPTCGVVIQKKDGTLEEIVCSEPATQLVSIVDPENQAKVIALILTCAKHDLDLEAGKTLIFKADGQDERIAVQFAHPSTPVPDGEDYQPILEEQLRRGNHVS